MNWSSDPASLMARRPGSIGPESSARPSGLARLDLDELDCGRPVASTKRLDDGPRVLQGSHPRCPQSTMTGTVSGTDEDIVFERSICDVECHRAKPYGSFLPTCRYERVRLLDATGECEPLELPLGAWCLSAL